eukprot:364319-Chlamydomonas_euryale.AAC.13
MHQRQQHSVGCHSAGKAGPGLVSAACSAGASVAGAVAGSRRVPIVGGSTPSCTCKRKKRQPNPVETYVDSNREGQPAVACQGYGFQEFQYLNSWQLPGPYNNGNGIKWRVSLVALHTHTTHIRRPTCSHAHSDTETHKQPTLTQKRTSSPTCRYAHAVCEADPVKRRAVQASQLARRRAGGRQALAGGLHSEDCVRGVVAQQRDDGRGDACLGPQSLRSCDDFRAWGAADCTKERAKVGMASRVFYLKGVPGAYTTSVKNLNLRWHTLCEHAGRAMAYLIRDCVCALANMIIVHATGYCKSFHPGWNRRYGAKCHAPGTCTPHCRPLAG